MRTLSIYIQNYITVSRDLFVELLKIEYRRTPEANSTHFHRVPRTILLVQDLR